MSLSPPSNIVWWTIVNGRYLAQVQKVDQTHGYLYAFDGHVNVPGWRRIVDGNPVTLVGGQVSDPAPLLTTVNNAVTAEQGIHIFGAAEPARDRASTSAREGASEPEEDASEPESHARKAPAKKA